MTGAFASYFAMWFVIVEAVSECEATRTADVEERVVKGRRERSEGMMGVPFTDKSYWYPFQQVGHNCWGRVD